jgi:hypothetical protein
MFMPMVPPPSVPPPQALPNKQRKLKPRKEPAAWMGRLCDDLIDTDASVDG